MAEKSENKISALLQTIIQRCRKEKDEGCVPLDDYFGRVSYYTGYPISLIKEITGISKHKKSNLEEHILLMVSMKSVLNMKMTPTLETLFKAFKENQEFLGSSSNKSIIRNLSNFCTLINSFKYEYRKTTANDLVVIENPKVTFERYHYLKQMKNLRSSEKLYYIDERCFDTNMSYKKPIVNKKFSETEYYTLFLLISSTGLEQHLFTTNGTQDVYKRWIENFILPILPPSSVIVMTNSYLHGNKKHLISGYDTKTQMMQWLRVHDIPHSHDMCKADLFDLIEKAITEIKLNNVDNILKSYGHKVLHLPSTFEELSPIEFLWEQIKSEQTLLNNINLYDAKSKLYTYITTLEQSHWATFFAKSIKAEDDILDLDEEIEATYDSICKLDDQYDLESKFYNLLVLT